MFTWTLDPPKESGHYWVLFLNKPELEAAVLWVEVDKAEDHITIDLGEAEFRPKGRDFDILRWAGPIPRPEVPRIIRP